MTMLATSSWMNLHQYVLTACWSSFIVPLAEQTAATQQRTAAQHAADPKEHKAIARGRSTTGCIGL